MNLLQHTIVNTLTVVPLVAPTINVQKELDLSTEIISGPTIEEAPITSYYNEGVRHLQAALNEQRKLKEYVDEMVKRTTAPINVKSVAQPYPLHGLIENDVMDNDKLLKMAIEALGMPRLAVAIRDKNGKIKDGPLVPLKIKEVTVILPPSLDQLCSNPFVLDAFQRISDHLHNVVRLVSLSQSTDPISLDRLKQLTGIAEQLAHTTEILSDLCRASSEQACVSENEPDPKDYSTTIGPKGNIVARIYREDLLTKKPIPIDPKVDILLLDAPSGHSQLEAVATQIYKMIQLLTALIPQDYTDTLRDAILITIPCKVTSPAGRRDVSIPEIDPPTLLIYAAREAQVLRVEKGDPIRS